MENVYLKEDTVLKKRYWIKKVLGIGGFGITYLAEDRNLEQIVVIKEYYPREIAGRGYGKDEEMNVIPRERNDRRRFLKGKKDFLAEARRMSKLFDIPEVVKILDWFEENGTAYLAMEYIRGISLDDYLQNQDVPFSFQQAWKMLRPVAEALEKIHKTGIIHRDLNPGNLMMEENGTIKIIDFGSARPYLETEKTMTILIKKGYAPLEQYMKKGRQGPWTDVYALCATIYEMITGVRPEPSIQRIEKDELYLPSAYGAEILPEEEEILCRGLELNYKQRFRTISDLCDSLKSIAKFPAEKAEKRKWTRWILPLGAVAIIAVVCMAVRVLSMTNREEPQKETYAGNYGRQSERYKEYVEFVKNHAISSQENGNDKSDSYEEFSTVYTLKTKDVKEWGEPCNYFRFNLTGNEYLQWMKENGYTMKKIKQKEENLVDIQEFGKIQTYFKKERIYQTENNIQIGMISDTVNDDLFKIYFVVPKEKKGKEKNILQATAEVLAQDISLDREGRENLRNLYDKMPENSQINTGFSFLLKEEEGDKVLTWEFTVDSSGFEICLWE